MEYTTEQAQEILHGRCLLFAVNKCGATNARCAAEPEADGELGVILAFKVSKTDLQIAVEKD